MTVVILEKTDEGLTSEQGLRTLAQKTGKKHLGGWLLQREHPPRVGTSASPPNPPKLLVVILDQKAGMEGTSAKSSRAGNKLATGLGQGLQKASTSPGFWFPKCILVYQVPGEKQMKGRHCGQSQHACRWWGGLCVSLPELTDIYLALLHMGHQFTVFTVFSGAARPVKAKLALGNLALLRPQDTPRFPGNSVWSSGWLWQRGTLWPCAK